MSDSNKMELLKQAWKEVFGVEEVEDDADFFGEGGDSIKAVQLSSWLIQKGVKLELGDIFQKPVLSEMAETLKEADPVYVPEELMTKEKAQNMMKEANVGGQVSMSQTSPQGQTNMANQQICDPNKMGTGNVANQQICDPDKMGAGDMANQQICDPDKMGAGNVANQQICDPDKMGAGDMANQQICDPDKMGAGDMANQQICDPKQMEGRQVCDPDQMKDQRVCDPNAMGAGNMADQQAYGSYDLPRGGYRHDPGHGDFRAEWNTMLSMCQTMMSQQQVMLQMMQLMMSRMMTPPEPPMPPMPRAAAPMPPRSARPVPPAPAIPGRNDTPFPGKKGGFANMSAGNMAEFQKMMQANFSHKADAPIENPNVIGIKPATVTKPEYSAQEVLDHVLSGLLKDGFNKEEDLFAQGLSSLDTVKMVTRCAEHGYALSMKDIYMHSTYNELLKCMKPGE